MSTNLKAYSEVEAGLALLTEECNFLPEVSTPEGYEKSKRIYLDNRSMYTKIDSIHKETKAEYLQKGREVDKAKNDLKGKIELLINPHKEAYQKIDEDKKQREIARAMNLVNGMERFKTIVINENPSIPFALDNLESRLKEAESIIIDDSWAEYQVKATDAKAEAIETLVKLIADTKKNAEEQEELAKLRELTEKQAQKDHEEKIAKDAAEAARLKAEEEKEEAVAKERDQAARAESQRQAAVAAQELAEKKAKDAEAKAISDAKEAAKEAERQTKQALEDAERDKQAAIKAELKAIENARLKDEADAKAREENKKHKAKINNQALKGLVAAGLSKEDAKKAVEAIAKGKVENVSISY